MTTIVLLDSDSSATEALSPSLRALRSEWIIHTAATGKKALELLCSTTVDVLITETQLSDMSGADLLDKVRAVSPDTIRFTLSSDLEAEIALEANRANHRFIAKPIETQRLVSAIDNSQRLREILESEDLKLFMRDVSSVPALPSIYEEMIEELSLPQSSLLKVSEIVERDAGLTIMVLKIVNSAFYGLSRRVESVSQAVTLLGAHLIKNITLTAKVFSKYEGSNLSIRRLTELNNQAVRMGALSNQFARYGKLSKSGVDHCQIAGMMSNVGALITATKTQDQAADEALPSNLIGAYLLQTWAMPDVIVEAVALQYEQPALQVESVSPHAVIHSIRYLQKTLTSSNDRQQRQDCNDYLMTYLDDANLTELWIDAYVAVEQLS